MAVKTVTAEVNGQTKVFTLDVPDNATQADIEEAIASYSPTQTAVPLGIPLSKRSPKTEGLQPQRGEPGAKPDAMSDLATGLTAGAAGAMVPWAAGASLASKAGIPALRALLAGGTTAGIDKAFGGAHPLQAGAVAGLGELGLEIPGTRKLLSKAVRGMFGLGESQAAEAAAPGLLKKQLMKYGGPTDPGFSPPSGPAKVTSSRTTLNKILGLPVNTPIENQLGSPEFVQALKNKPAAAKAAQDLLDALGMPTTESKMKLNIRRRVKD